MSKQNQKSNQKRVDLCKKILCACNGRECEGICRETHLTRNGICSAAYNETHNRDKRISRERKDVYTGVFGDL